MVLRIISTSHASTFAPKKYTTVKLLYSLPYQCKPGQRFSIIQFPWVYSNLLTTYANSFQSNSPGTSSNSCGFCGLKYSVKWITQHFYMHNLWIEERWRGGGVSKMCLGWSKCTRVSSLRGSFDLPQTWCTYWMRHAFILRQEIYKERNVFLLYLQEPLFPPSSTGLVGDSKKIRCESSMLRRLCHFSGDFCDTLTALWDF